MVQFLSLRLTLRWFLASEGRVRLAAKNLGGMDYLGCEGSFHFSRRVENVLGQGAILLLLVPRECSFGSVIVLGRRVLST